MLASWILAWGWDAQYSTMFNDQALGDSVFVDAATNGKLKENNAVETIEAEFAEHDVVTKSTALTGDYQITLAV